MADMKTWTRQTLGGAAAVGSPINLWCNSATCGYRLEHGRPYRATLSAADLANYAEKYGDAVTFEDFRKRLRCRHCGSGDVSTIVDAHHATPGERWGARGTGLMPQRSLSGTTTAPVRGKSDTDRIPRKLATYLPRCSI
jgi:hypothetical protein